MFKIFPCNHNKIPLVTDWQSLATTDQAQIAAWTATYGEAIGSWGIPTGPTNNLLVLDIDVKKGTDGFKALEGKSIPTTMSQTTPSGGLHYIYEYPADGEHYGNKVGFLPGLDARGDGGYICYYGTDTQPIAKAPTWFLESVKANSQPLIQGDLIKVSSSIGEQQLLESLENIREAPEGESNNILNIEAFKVGQLVKAGSITEARAKEQLLSAAKDRGKPDYEANATINSAFKGSNIKPLTSPFGEPVLAFPLPDIPVQESWTPKQFTLFDLTNTSHLKKPQLFENWSSEDIHLTTADGGTGKTTLKLNEAICLALGESFLTFRCLQPGGKTLFITGEDTAEKLGAMIGMICKQMGILNNAEKMNKVLSSIVVKKDSDMCIITKDKQGFLAPNQDAMNKVLQAVHDIKPKMVVFDPISSFWGSEAALNDMAKAVNKFMGRVATEGKCCVEMINHMGKTSSSTKDMSQFAGRGGTGLPSNARVSRVMRAIDEEEYTKITGRELEDSDSPIMINVNKFTDGSPLLNVPFLAVRKGFLFVHQTINMMQAKENNEGKDIARLMGFMKEALQSGKYPTKSVAIGFFANMDDKLSKDRVVNALNVLTFMGHKGETLKIVDNPDMTQDEKVYVLADVRGKEI